MKFFLFLCEASPVPFHEPPEISVAPHVTPPLPQPTPPGRQEGAEEKQKEKEKNRRGVAEDSKVKRSEREPELSEERRNEKQKQK